MLKKSSKGIAWLTRKLGIRQCAGCKKRQAWLNRWFQLRGEPDDGEAFTG